MLFWLICSMATLCVLAALAVPLLRDREGQDAAPDVEIYKAQLAEVERDTARGIIDPDEAERARTEIARRLLAAHKSEVVTGEAPRKATRVVLVFAAAVLSCVSVWSYLSVGAPGEADQPLQKRLANADVLRENRPGQAALEAAAPERPPVEVPSDYFANVAELREIMQTRPEDQRGWELLAYHEAELRNYGAAAAAQARVVSLLDAEATNEDRRRLVDMMVAAADGYVSPEAEAIVQSMLAEDPRDVPGRYYLGALYGQTGRPDLAFRLWRPLVEEEADSFHTALARAQIDGMAEMAGVRYSAPPLRGPSLDDIEAAEGLSAEDRATMIAGMVAQLSDRLATEGGGPAEWARLIRAYGVLGDSENARAIWTEARDVFGADTNAMVQLEDAARSAGVIE